MSADDYLKLKDEVSWLKKQLLAVLQAGELGIRYYQCGSTVGVPGTTVIVIQDAERAKLGGGPADFWALQEGLVKYLECGVRPGDRCPPDLFPSRCPNAEAQEERNRYYCSLCGQEGKLYHDLPSEDDE